MKRRGSAAKNLLASIGSMYARGEPRGRLQRSSQSKSVGCGFHGYVLGSSVVRLETNLIKHQQMEDSQRIGQSTYPSREIATDIERAMAIVKKY